MGREFQVFAKPVGARCNLSCSYCYSLLNHPSETARMPDDLLESYVIQHIHACTEQTIHFSWHGGEPTLFGLDSFRRVVALQRQHCPEDRRIANGIQTNGILLDDDWCRFLADESFFVGLSLDGIKQDHDRHRKTSTAQPTHSSVIEAYERLQRHGVMTEFLCVVHSDNVDHPGTIYDFFRTLGIRYVTFLPLLEPLPGGGVSERTVSAQAWGRFLCSIFDVWLERDIGRINIQMFEEATRPAFGLEHTLCLFRKTCNVPVLYPDGEVFSCDHFITPEHRLGNIRETSLSALLDIPQQQTFGSRKQQTLSRQCRTCPVLDMCNGGCPKDRIIRTPDGEPGLNYFCAGYKRFFTHCRPFVDALAQVFSKPPEIL